jgi:hypothetical protein
MMSLIRPKHPIALGWSRDYTWTPPPQLVALGFPVVAWRHDSSGLFCLSAVEVAQEPGKPDLGAEYHLSISLNGQRCDSADAVFALAAFGLLDATEDNHVPSGRVRNFWRPVADRLSGFECPCTGHEPTIREDKGDYVWRGVTL